MSSRPVSGLICGHVAATAVGAPAVLDDVRSEGQEQLIEGVGVLAVLPAIVVVRA